MPTLSADETLLLQLFLDRIIPPDGYPGAVEAGVMNHVEARFAADPLTVDTYQAGLMILRQHGFADLAPKGQDQVISSLENHPSIALMIGQVIEGYYAGPESVGAQMVGFRVTA